MCTWDGRLHTLKKKSVINPIMWIMLGEIEKSQTFIHLKISLYDVSKVNKFIKTEIRMAVSKGREEETIVT